MAREDNATVFSSSFISLRYVSIIQLKVVISLPVRAGCAQTIRATFQGSDIIMID